MLYGARAAEMGDFETTKKGWVKNLPEKRSLMGATLTDAHVWRASRGRPNERERKEGFSCGQEGGVSRTYGGGWSPKGKIGGKESVKAPRRNPGENGPSTRCGSWRKRVERAFRRT